MGFRIPIRLNTAAAARTANTAERRYLRIDETNPEEGFHGRDVQFGRGDS